MTDEKKETGLAEVSKEVETQFLGEVKDGALVDFLTNQDASNHLWKIAKTFAASQLVPEIFRGNPNDCFVALQLASRLQVDGFAVMQNVHVIHGKPGFAAPFAIALANHRGPFDEPIQWDIKGEGKSLVVTAFSKFHGRRVEATVSYKTAELEGWTKPKKDRKTGATIPSKYETIPEQMLCYRSATFLIRRYAPHVLLGMATRDELIDRRVAETGEVVDRDDLEGSGATGRNLADMDGAKEEFEGDKGTSNKRASRKRASGNRKPEPWETDPYRKGEGSPANDGLFGSDGEKSKSE